MQEDFIVAGSMHRGESTSGQMRRVDPDAISTMSSKSARITFNALRLENVDHFRSIAAAKLVFKVSLQHGRRRPASWSWRGSKSTQTRPSASTLVKLRGPGGGNGVWTLLDGRSWEWRGGGSGSGTNVFAFDTGSDMGLHFELADKRGFTCFGSAHCSASHQLPFRQVGLHAQVGFYTQSQLGVHLFKVAFEYGIRELTANR